MKTYDMALLTKRIQDSQLQFFTLDTLCTLLAISQKSSLFAVIQRLIQAGVIEKVERNTYLRHPYQGSELALANFLYHPSYVSFETALSFYGILAQFPTEVTSATLKLPRRKMWQEQQFSYVHIKKDLFWGYIKQENYLIAEPEKAVLDQIYIATKGSKSLSFDEYDFTQLEKKKIVAYARQFPQTRQFLSGMKRLEEYL